jgi:hypothetical protein
VESSAGAGVELALYAGDAGQLTPADFLLGALAPEFPFEILPTHPDGWTRVAFRGESEPVFSFEGGRCRVRRADGWRRALALLLFNRLLRLREDALFFHAASVEVGGRGVLFVGPKGAGKSTTALALAGLGHPLLGDETACYLPASGTLVPCRRPVGIRPGPRAASIDRALARLGLDPAKDGPLRLPVETLLPSSPAASVPLGVVVFLREFAPRPSLERIAPGRDEVALLQPFVGSLVNASPTRRVFEMARLLSSASVFRLAPGAPDETASHLENALRA